MGIFTKIGSVLTKVSAFLTKIQKAVGLGITNAFDKLSGAAKIAVPIAVKVVQGLKTFMASDYDDVVVAIVTAANPTAGKYASKAQVWIEKILPKVAVKLEIIKSISELEGIENTTEAIMAKLQLSEKKGEKALALATELALYLSDGKFTFAEIKDAANDYYNYFVKPTK